MRKKIIALLLTGGLMTGLCGCEGSSGDSSLPPETVAEESHVSAGTIETVTSDDSEPEEPEKLGVAEPEYGTHTDETWEEENPEDESVMMNIDAEKLLSTYVVEFEDLDGYKIRETLQVSPIFTEDDTETMRALWVALGNDASIFPSEESFYEIGEHDVLEYVIGTYKVENLTDGFPVTPDNPRNYIGRIVPEEDPSVPRLYIVNMYDYFKYAIETIVVYSNDTVYYGGPHTAPLISDTKMESDVWGPQTFIIALPNVSTPDLPDGYRYDSLQYELLGNHHANGEEYAIFKLKYYTKEVE